MARHIDAATSLPMGAIALGAVVGLCVGALSWHDFDGVGWGLIYGGGFSADMLYRVARSGALYGAMAGGVLAVLWRATSLKLGATPFAALALSGKFFASFACAITASMTAGHWLSLFPVARTRFAAVGGLAVWQMASLGLLTVLLLAFGLLSDFAHRMVINGHSWRRLALCAESLAVAVLLPLAMRGLDGVLIARLRTQSAPPYEVDSSDDADEYRLPCDEPWDHPV